MTTLQELHDDIDAPTTVGRGRKYALDFGGGALGAAQGAARDQTTGDGPDSGGAVLETAPELLGGDSSVPTSPALGPSIQVGGTVQPGPKSQKRANATIITGNPKYIADNPEADAFYSALQKHLEEQGYSVTRDPGKPFTVPEPSDLWIGHSRGADRLRFAPQGTRTVAIGSSLPGAVNHPDDDLAVTPNAAHYQLTPEMLQQITKESIHVRRGSESNGSSGRDAAPHWKSPALHSGEPAGGGAGDKLAADKATSQALREARKVTNTSPTEAQQEAGNYAKGKVKLHGMTISLENPKGSIRSGKDGNGKAWSIKMKHDYGYINLTEGRDGDHVDVFVGPDPDVELVWVVNQHVGGKFDEHKCLIGFGSEEAAREGYLANYQEGWDGLASIYPITVPQFKWWLEHGDITKEIKDGAFAAHRRNNRSGLRKAGESRRSEVVSDDEDFWKSPLNKQGRKCPGCGQLFRECEPLPGVSNCETCERFGPPKQAADDRPFSVAVDLDGTLAEDLEVFDPAVIGPPRSGAKKWMQQLHDFGPKKVRLIVHTCRGEEDVVRDWLDEHDIPFDHINENPDQPPGTSDKLYADVYWDNRAIDASGPLYKSAPEVLARLESKAARDISLVELHESLNCIPANVKSAAPTPYYQQGLLAQAQAPVFDPSGNWMSNVMTNLQMAREHAERRIHEQEQLDNIRSALEPGFAQERFQRYMQDGDFVKDPVDQVMFRRAWF